MQTNQTPGFFILTSQNDQYIVLCIKTLYSDYSTPMSSYDQFPAIVFVDPQDPCEEFWWPAVVVNPAEREHFFSEMGEPIAINNDILVCYFEDASYSAVKNSEITPFARDAEPFVSYLSNKTFLKTKGAKNMLSFIDEGKVPSKFKWLKKRRRRVSAEGGVRKKIILERALKEFKDV